mgnify:CR=1 FL=1
MGIITVASGKSLWRGLDYYKSDKVKDIVKINENEYTSKVEGTETYNVYLNIKHVKKSKCNCPLADGKMIVCKHIVATYFKVVSGSGEDFEREQEELEEEYEEYENERYEKVEKYVRKLSKSELIDEMLELLNYVPDWVYDDFIDRNDIY